MMNLKNYSSVNFGGFVKFSYGNKVSDTYINTNRIQSLKESVWGIKMVISNQDGAGYQDVYSSEKMDDILRKISEANTAYVVPVIEKSSQSRHEIY